MSLDDSILWISVAIICILAIISVFIGGQSKSKLGNRFNKEQMALEYNQLIGSYNLAVEKYGIQLEETNNFASYYKDFSSLKKAGEVNKKCTNNFKLILEEFNYMKDSVLSENTDAYYMSYDTVSKYLSDIQNSINELIVIKESVCVDTSYYYNSQNYQEHNIEEHIDSSSSELKYFNGCMDMESLEKRYKSLAKVYHPDVNNGDQQSFVVMRDEYELCKKKLSEENL